VKVVITGASGMIGSALTAELLAQGHQVRTMTREEDTGDYVWGARPGTVPEMALTWADALVSLNGVSLSRLPWTQAYQYQIVASRVDATTALAQAIATSSDPPKVWVSGSAVGYYGDTEDADLEEYSPSGKSFLAQVVRAWENATKPAEEKTRVVLARTGLVLSEQGALKPLIATTRAGLGSRIGPGTQFWPWISLIDEVRAIAYCLDNKSLSGPINLVGPQPARSLGITRAVARALNRPHLLVLPSAVIRVLMSGADELLLSSQKAHPRALLDAGFTFTHPNAGEAISSLGLG